MRSFTALTALFTVFAGTLHAACTTPTGQAGDTIFSDAAKTMQYCNGTNWVNTGKSVPAATQTGCTSPIGGTGSVIYNGSTGVVQFCNGQNWMDTACAADRTLGGPGCSGKPAGSIQYSSTANELQFCDSTNWVAMGWGCAGSAASQTGLIDWSLIQKIIAADGASTDNFGYSVAIYNDTALIGSYGDDDLGSNSGSVYVFVRSGSTWTQQAKLTASDGASNDYFGYSVSLYNDTALVGAYRDNSNRGAAYVFVRSGSTWTQQAKLTASDGTLSDQFGISLAIFDNTALIGSYGDDDLGSNSGSAYVFVRSGSTWTQQAKLTASDGAADDSFGNAVALSSDTAIVGSPADDDLGSDSGSAYVFVRSGSTWTQQAKLTVPDGAPYDSFGLSVTISDNTVLIGAYLDNEKGAYSGSAYVFTRSGSAWTQQAKLTASDGAAQANFGKSVSLVGNTALIGAMGDPETGFNSGAAYIFTRSGTVWTEQDKLISPDGEPYDNLGISVALSENTAIVGAIQDDGITTNSGSAYIFTP